MKKTITHPINDKHFATVEFDGSQVLIYIEKHKKTFFNLIKTSIRVSKCKIYELVSDEIDFAGKEYEFRGTLNCWFAGRCQTLKLTRIKLRSFDLKSEINTLYADYLKSLKSKQNTQKRIDNLIKNL